MSSHVYMYAHTYIPHWVKQECQNYPCQNILINYVFFPSECCLSRVNLQSPSKKHTKKAILFSLVKTLNISYLWNIM